MIAIAKYFAFHQQEAVSFNEQEANADINDYVVDDRTAYELYYEPFRRAIQIGKVGGIVCE